MLNLAVRNTVTVIADDNGMHSQIVCFYFYVNSSGVRIAGIPNKFSESGNGLSGRKFLDMVALDFHRKVLFRHVRLPTSHYFDRAVQPVALSPTDSSPWATCATALA